jgi:hypothetical protein
MKVEGRQTARQSLLYGFAIFGVVTLIYSVFSGLFGGFVVPTALAQQDPFLSRRVDQMEQRFYTIESRLTRLEQDSRVTRITPQLPTNNDTDIQFLRTQLDGMRLRLGEVECGLLRVDERTLSSAAKAARSKAGVTVTDRCRLEPSVPVQLSARP